MIVYIACLRFLRRRLSSQVMLFSQGFTTAECLAGKVVPLFKLCQEQLSPQQHYDFGLRALKSVLISAGSLKRSDLLAPPPKEVWHRYTA